MQGVQKLWNLKHHWIFNLKSNFKPDLNELFFIYLVYNRWKSSLCQFNLFYWHCAAYLWLFCVDFEMITFCCTYESIFINFSSVSSHKLCNRSRGRATSWRDFEGAQRTRVVLDNYIQSLTECWNRNLGTWIEGAAAVWCASSTIRIASIQAYSLWENNRSTWRYGQCNSHILHIQIQLIPIFIKFHWILTKS